MPRDLEGVQRAEAELEHTTRQLNRDQAEVIRPLRHEAYRNNIQALVENLLRQRGAHGPDTGSR